MREIQTCVKGQPGERSWVQSSAPPIQRFAIWWIIFWAVIWAAIKDGFRTNSVPHIYLSLPAQGKPASQEPNG